MSFGEATSGQIRIPKWRIAALAGAMFLIAGVAWAEVAVDTVVANLHRPRGIAVRPGGTADRFEIFIADSGAGRVVRWSNQSPDQTSDVISGFAVGESAELSAPTAPLAIGFLDPGLVVVGTAQGPAGNLVQTFELQDDDKVLAAHAAGDAKWKSPRLQGAACTSFARAHVNEYVSDRLFLAVRSADGGTSLWSSRVQAGMLREPSPFGDTKSDRTRAVAISRSGRVLAAEKGGRLVFYSPVDGKVELAVQTELDNPTGLAYDPSTGGLYATDFGGGIYRLDDVSQRGHPACRTVKVADVSRPTALAFAPDGSLYVLTFGTAGDNGTLSVLSGEF